MLHQGIRTVQMDLKERARRADASHRAGQRRPAADLVSPLALAKLGLGWRALRQAHPALVAGGDRRRPGERAEEPDHDLTYLAAAGLVTGTELPPTLLADMARRAASAVEAALTRADAGARQRLRGVHH